LGKSSRLWQAKLSLWLVSGFRNSVTLTLLSA